jgi:pyruvate kinase
MRHTKIVATVGPASNTPEKVHALIAAGVDVFRLNFSHGTHAAHAAVYQTIRTAALQAGRVVAIMQDLSGPKIRTGPNDGGGPIDLKADQELMIAAGDSPGTDRCIFTPYAPLVQSARSGDRLLLDDGRIELRVVDAGPAGLRTRVVSGGPLGAHKGINAPGVALPASAVTDKDAADLRFGLELGVDLVALSFVQTAGDVQRAKSIMSDAGRSVPVIAKIERPAAVDNLTGILEAAHGVMVARGDLGLEMPLEQLPRVQKTVIRSARQHGRPVIVATQVLESMRVDPRPTRAEVSDAANAVDEGVDAIMLAGETAIGAYPVQSVATLHAIVREAESMPSAERVMPVVNASASRHDLALCEAAVTLATVGRADAIVAITHEGKTARLLSAFRPQAPVYAATPHESIGAALSLCWGIVPFVTPERDASALQRIVLERQLIPGGSVVVFVNVDPELHRIDANFVNVQRLG